MTVWVTVSDGKALSDGRVLGSTPLVLEIGEAIDLASEMLGAATIARPVAESCTTLKSADQPAPRRSEVCDISRRRPTSCGLGEVLKA